MTNKSYALEWLALAERNLETARLLIKEKHFTDSIAIEIHQSIEKSFKSIYGLHGEKIPRSHSLTILHEYIKKYITLDNLTLDDLIIISDYYETEKYPGPKYFIPDRSEVENYFSLSEEILRTIKDFILKANK